MTNTQLTFIDMDTDLGLLFEPYQNESIENDIDDIDLPDYSLKTIDDVAKADEEIYNQYQKLFVIKISQFIKDSIGERSELPSITKLIEKMGFAGFHSGYSFDFQSMLDSFGAHDENDIYFGGDKIYNECLGLYNESSAKLRFMSENEDLYDDYIMSL